MLAKADRYSYWGVLLERLPRKASPQDFSRAFAAGLLWHCVGAVREKDMILRRSGFPTWCWVSVIGAIDHQTLIGGDYLDTIAVEDFDGATRSLADLFEGEAGQGQVAKELTPFLHITSIVSRVTLRLDANRDHKWHVCRGRVYFQGADKSGMHATIYIDLFTDTSLVARLEQESWQLMRVAGRRYWLILDWKGSTAYRVGRIVIGDDYYGWGNLNILEEVKTIRLG